MHWQSRLVDRRIAHIATRMYLVNRRVGSRTTGAELAPARCLNARIMSPWSALPPGLPSAGTATIPTARPLRHGNANCPRGTGMNRRFFMKTAAIGSLAAGFAGAAAAISYFPAPVDLSLFEGINRVKDPARKTGHEKNHAPAITAPAAVKAGEPFKVEISVGETLHSMGPSHWIQYIELNIGNEPAGRLDFQARGFMKPTAVFTITIPKELVATGKLTLLAREQCNLHGLWETRFDIAVS